MSLHTLHLLDPSTSPDAVEALLHLLHHATPAQPQAIAILGHRSTHQLLLHTATPSSLPPLYFVPSLGWADPATWRGVKRLIRRCQPIRVHAWGLPAAVAAAMGARAARSKAQRLVTLGEVGPAPRRTALRLIEHASLRSRRLAPPLWIGMANWISREIQSWGVPFDRIQTIPLGIPLPPPAYDRTALRQRLGIHPHDGPVILLAGEGTGVAAHWARHDYGLWTGGILQQVFPRVRVLGREDPRSGGGNEGKTNDGWMRLMNDLADGDIPVLAPPDLSWPELLAAADILAVPADGPVASAAILHAMAAGVPVAGMPVTPTQEFVEDNVTGLICRDVKPRSLAGPLELLLNDSDTRTRITTTAKDRIAEQYALPTMLTAYANLPHSTSSLQPA